VQLYCTIYGRLKVMLTLPTSSIYSLLFSDDAKRIACRTSNDENIVIDIETGIIERREPVSDVLGTILTRCRSRRARVTKKRYKLAGHDYALLACPPPHGALKLPPSQQPTTATAADCLLNVRDQFVGVSNIELMVVTCEATARGWFKRQRAGAGLGQQEAVALCAYLHEVGGASITDDGSDNFYFMLDSAFTTKHYRTLALLGPYLYFFRRAYHQLQGLHDGVYFRALPWQYRDEVRGKYDIGQAVLWPSMVGLWRTRAEALDAAECVGEGVVIAVKVSEGRFIDKYTSTVGHVLLPPSTTVMVTEEMAVDIDDDSFATVTVLQLRGDWF
jgi:hypothetical protein